MKIVLFFMSLVNLLSTLVDRWREQKAVEAGRQEVRASQTAANQKAKVIAVEIHKRTAAASDADVDRQLHVFRRD